MNKGGFKKGNKLSKGRPRGSLNKKSKAGDCFHKQMELYGNKTGVYLLEAGGRYKIGITMDLRQRFMSVIGVCPFQLNLVWFLETAHSRMAERILHNIFRLKRIHYEWFELDENDVNRIKDIKCFEDIDKLLKHNKTCLLKRETRLARAGLLNRRTSER